MDRRDSRVVSERAAVENKKKINSRSAGSEKLGGEFCGNFCAR